MSSVPSDDSQTDSQPTSVHLDGPLVVVELTGSNTGTGMCTCCVLYTLGKAALDREPN